MRILVLGGGGREHALAWKISQSPLVTELICAPGNPGMAALGRTLALDIEDPQAVLSLVTAETVDLTVIGPEAPLLAGVADALLAAGHRTFGPTRAAAMLEGSKTFAKSVCRTAGIPTARAVHHTDLAAAQDYARQAPLPCVVKADGLAAGKGVIIAHDRAQAAQAVEALFALSEGGLLFEECLEGEEVSLFALCDGKTALACGTAQDHKRIGEGDQGPNTGGMGAFSPYHRSSAAVEQALIDQFIQPTLDDMRRRGTPFSGVLYAGLMMTKSGPKLIEFNCRFGDPECQVLMTLMADDILPYLLATAEGKLAGMAAPRFHPGAALGVVLASAGYPDTPQTGDAIEGLAAPIGASSAPGFQAGTRMQDGALVTAGGRVACLCARGDTLKEAADRAYAGVEQVFFEGQYYRRDIGWRALS